MRAKLTVCLRISVPAHRSEMENAPTVSVLCALAPFAVFTAVPGRLHSIEHLAQMRVQINDNISRQRFTNF